MTLQVISEMLGGSGAVGGSDGGSSCSSGSLELLTLSFRNSLASKYTFSHLQWLMMGLVCSCAVTVVAVVTIGTLELLGLTSTKTFVSSPSVIWRGLIIV